MRGTITYTLNRSTLINGVTIDHESEVEIEYDGRDVLSVTDTDSNNPNPDMYAMLTSRDWERVEQAIVDAQTSAAERMRD